MPKITCCKDCVPPKRHPGCGATCDEYIKQCEERKQELKWLREVNQQGRDTTRILMHLPLDGKSHKKKRR